MNTITVPDNHPLPLVADILCNCAGHKFYRKINMTNSFFQTRMHPESVKYMAVNTLFGLYEWLVMLMGLRNSPAVHQRQVFSALRSLIRKICHVYLDVIIIWSNSLEEHETNVSLVLEALHMAHLYCSALKSTFWVIISPYGVLRPTQTKSTGFLTGPSLNQQQTYVRFWISSTT